MERQRSGLAPSWGLKLVRRLRLLSREQLAEARQRWNAGEEGDPEFLDETPLRRLESSLQSIPTG
jgi:hypothetical protein